MTLKVPLTTENYIKVMNGFLSLTGQGGLTDSEIKVLATFYDTYVEIEAKSKTTLNPFCITIKKAVAKRLGKNSPHSLNNVIKALKDKKAIRPHPGGSGYRFHPILIPRSLVSFEFNAENPQS